MTAAERIAEIKLRAEQGEYHAREHWGFFDADEDVLFLISQIPTPACATCRGLQFITKYETSDLGNGLRSGGAWNEPCPDCVKPAAHKEGPKP